jgi:hypothetical protein
MKDLCSNGFTLTVGDIKTPIGALLQQSGKPVDLTGKTVKFAMVNAQGDEVIAPTASHVSIRPAYPFTIDSALGSFYQPSHVLQDGMQVTVESTDELPSALEDGRRYFAIDCDDNTFRLAMTASGQGVSCDDDGAGDLTYRIVGTVAYEFQAADVSVAGEYWGWFIVVDSNGKTSHFPVGGRRMRILIEAAE